MWDEILEWYGGVSLNKERKNQLKPVIKILKDSFKFDSVICIETGASKDFATDGAVGTILAKASNLTGGEFHSVDNDPNVTEKSKNLYDSLKLTHHQHTSDSVKFLKETSIIPNLVHLDSWNVNLKNPLPCALHGWREFEAIEDKMPVGSILIVDDNWFKGTWIEWVYPHKPNERIDIDYPILGKGALIWHFIESGESNWVKLSEDVVGSNEKLVYKKIKSSNTFPNLSPMTSY